MAYERLDQALRQLKTDREREEATEKQHKREGEEAKMRFAQIKSAVIGPIFNEIVAHLVDDYVRITDPVTMRKAQSTPGLSAANYNQSVIPTPCYPSTPCEQVSCPAGRHAGGGPIGNARRRDAHIVSLSERAPEQDDCASVSRSVLGGSWLPLRLRSIPRIA